MCDVQIFCELVDLEAVAMTSSISVREARAPAVEQKGTHGLQWSAKDDETVKMVMTVGYSGVIHLQSIFPFSNLQK